MDHLQLPGHKAVLGMTGSGKSFAVKDEIRGHKGGVLALDPKNEGDWPCYYLTGREDILDMYGALKHGAHLAYVPDKDPEAATRLLSKVCEDLLAGSWGDLWLVIDEAEIYAPKSVPNPLTWISLRGRSCGVKGVWVCQRPAGLQLLRRRGIFARRRCPHLARFSLPGCGSCHHRRRDDRQHS